MTDSTIKAQIRALVQRAADAEEAYVTRSGQDGSRGMVFVEGVGVDVGDKQLDLLVRRANSAVKELLTLLRTREALDTARDTAAAAEEAKKVLQALVDASKDDA